MAKIISFEGIDGTGKTTQIKLIEDLLKKNGYKVTVRSYPVYDSFFGNEIGEHLSGKDKTKFIDPKSMALWYALDRWNDYKNNSTIFQENDVVLLNRYTLSSMVYQVIRAGGSAELAKWIEELEHIVFSLPRPELYLIFDLPFDIAYKNNQIKGKRDYIDSEVDKYEKDEKLQSNARELYLKFGGEMKNAGIIKCYAGEEMLSIEQIHKNVKTEIEKILEQINI